MRRTTLLITALGAGMLVIGCVSAGEQQNYTELDDERPLFEPEDPSRASWLETSVIHLAADMDEPVPQGQEAGTEKKASELAFDQRQQWPIVIIEPVNGQTRHNPIYFRDFELDDTYVNVINPPNAMSRFDAALHASSARTWSLTNDLGAVAQPDKFGIDLLLVPVYQFTEGWILAQTTSA